MNFFLGIVPDEKANHKIRRILAEVGTLFDANGVPISLTKPENFHITVIFLSKTMPLFKRLFINYKVSRFPIKRFKISAGKVRLGISRNYRELLFLTIDEGAENLRNIVYQLAPKLKIKRDQIFIPHLTLGRVGKDLTDEEFMNLSESIAELNTRLAGITGEISFTVESIEHIKSDDGEFKTLKSFKLV